MFVEIKEVNMQIIMPVALIKRGKYIPFCDTNSGEVDVMIKQAQVLSANDPNKSDPIPAMSPTLSPTLSAMTPGFIGLSSGRF